MLEARVPGPTSHTEYKGCKTQTASFSACGKPLCTIMNTFWIDGLMIHAWMKEWTK